MPDTPTPGQVCYEAHARHMQHEDPSSLWTFLWPEAQAAWEAAAEAVRARVVQDLITGGVQARHERHERQEDTPHA